MHRRKRSLTTYCLAWFALFPWAGAYAAEGDPAARNPAVYSQLDRAQSINRDVSFFDPPTVESAEAHTTALLRVVEAVNRFNGVDLRHRSYNGMLVGPTIEVRPGQDLLVRLENRLDPERGRDHEDYQPHGFNTTNLHTHGLHVSPRSPADDVFREIGPGDSFDYKFEIPADHPGGTFWYHAHKHGSTALQLASGMAGALIVRGPVDDIPEIRSARERVMVLQQVTYKEIEGEPAIVDAEGLYDETGALTLAINGVVTPTVMMRPGEVQRWRLIHAGTSEAIRVNAEGVNFFEIAQDGLTTGRIEEKGSIRLYPGYRSDVLVKAPSTEGARLAYSLVRDPEETIRGRAVERTDLLRVVVSGPPLPMSLPSEESLQAVAPHKPDDVPTDEEVGGRRRTLTFSQEGKDRFLIDNEKFDPAEVKQTISLNTAEEWTLVSDSGRHPFHIHVNPFAVKPSVAGAPWVWKDTILVGRRPVVIRSRFLRFTGKTVLHCHNLTHEDKGMMQSIEIVDNAPPQGERASAQARRAPAWRATGPGGLEHRSEDYGSAPLLLVLHRGMNCVHCTRQMAELKRGFDRLKRAGIQVVAVSQYLPRDVGLVKQLRDYPFPILVDPDLACFEAYDCIDERGRPLHGLFLIDGDGRIAFQRRTETALSRPVELIIAKYLQPQQDTP